MAGMEEALKNIMMQRAMRGGGAPTQGSMPMAPGSQGRPMPTAGSGSVNPAVLKAVMAAKGGKAAPKAKGKAAPKKAAPKGKGKPVAKKKAK